MDDNILINDIVIFKNKYKGKTFRVSSRLDDGLFILRDDKSDKTYVAFPNDLLVVASTYN